MSAVIPYTKSAFQPQAKRGSITLSSALLRFPLLAVCLLAVLAATWLGEPAAYLAADPALGQLLRGMALIKAAIVVAAVALLLWRFGWRVSPWAALAYGVSSGLMAGSSMLIWQLTFIPLAAALFHIGGLVMLLVSCRDHAQARFSPVFAAQRRV